MSDTVYDRYVRILQIINGPRQRSDPALMLMDIDAVCWGVPEDWSKLIREQDEAGKLHVFGPSNSGPIVFCKDCRHSLLGGFPSRLCGRRNTMVIDPVEGFTRIQLQTPRCHDERSEKGACGPEGKYYAPPLLRRRRWGLWRRAK